MKYNKSLLSVAATKRPPQDALKRALKLSVREKNMKSVVAILSLVLSACASTAPPPTAQMTDRFPDGMWLGSLEIQSTRNANTSVTDPYKIAVAACGGDVRVWYQRNDGLYDTPKPKFGVESRLGSHLLRFVDSEDAKDPSWVETQTLLLIAMPTDEFRVHWSRGVSNRLEEPNAGDRFVFEHGIGSIARVGNQCEPDGVHPPGTQGSP